MTTRAPDRPAGGSAGAFGNKVERSQIFESYVFDKIDSEMFLRGSESLKEVSKDVPGSPEDALRRPRRAPKRRPWWLARVRQKLQFPGCREHVLAVAATA